MAHSSFECFSLEEMVARMQKFNPGDDYALVEKAFRFAQEAHAGQFRKSGEPYFSHPQNVASILVEIMIDAPTIAAGLLHDTIEDNERITLEVIEKEFGAEVALLVD